MSFGLPVEVLEVGLSLDGVPAPPPMHERFRPPSIPESMWRGYVERVRKGVRTRPTSPKFYRPPGLLVDPGCTALQNALRLAASIANGRSRVRTVDPLPVGSILRHPCGLWLENGHPHRHTPRHMWPTSAVGAAWFTLAGRKFVRVWGNRGQVSGPRHSLRLLPEPTDGEGLRRCWEQTFPERATVLLMQRTERIRRILERFGSGGQDDGSNLAPHTALVRAYAPGVGVILSDDYARPRLVQVVVRDRSTGRRHHLTVPPRFGNPGSRAFRQLGSAEARVRAAVAWTSSLTRGDYTLELDS